MKKIIKVLVIVILAGVLCFEGFLMLKKDKTEEEATNDKVVYKKIVSDATKTYRKNGLEFEIESEDGYYYHQISGLKNKDIQKKVNKLIKNRTREAMKNIEEDEDYNTVTSIRGSFSNILSLEIGLGPAPSLIDSYVYVVYDVLNIDLNTGNELTIDDITLSTEGLREPLYKGIEETATYNQGFAGIMSTNKYAKYERVEDAALSVMNKFNSKNYMFTISEQGIMLYFNDVYINTPEYIYFDEEDFGEYTEEELKHFENSCLKGEDEDGYGYFYCDDKYETTYDIFIPLSYIADDIIVYDTYVKDESIFKEDGEEFLRYVNDETENRIRKIIMYEEDNNIKGYIYLKPIETDDKSERHAKIIEQNNEKIAKIQKMIAGIEKRQRKAFKMYLDGKVSEKIYNDEISNIEKEHTQWMNDIVRLESENRRYSYESEQIDNKNKWESTNLDEIEDAHTKREIIQSVVRELSVHKVGNHHYKIFVHPIDVRVAEVYEEMQQHFDYRTSGHKITLWDYNKQVGVLDISKYPKSGETPSATIFKEDEIDEDGKLTLPPTIVD